MPFPDSANIICFASIFVFPEIGPSELEQIFAAAKAQGKLVCADMTKRKKSETTEDLAFANECGARTVAVTGASEWL